MRDLMAGGTEEYHLMMRTAGKARAGYKTATTDSDDEIIEGTMVNRGNGMVTVEFGDALLGSKIAIGWNKAIMHVGISGKPWRQYSICCIS